MGRQAKSHNSITCTLILLEHNHGVIPLCFVHSVFVSELFSGVFRITLIHILFGPLLGNLFQDCCGLSRVSPYVYYLILKDEIPKGKETRTVIPSQETTQPVKHFYQVTLKYIRDRIIEAQRFATKYKKGI